MKRIDAFMLTVMAFVLANCISYFVRSGAPYVTGWGMNRPDRGHGSEAVGFPFLVFFKGVGHLPVYRLHCVVNVVIVFAASSVSSKHLAKRLPPLWSGHSRAMRFSLRDLLVGIALVCYLLGTAMTSPALGLAVRNVVCFSGPTAAYLWLLYRRQASWARLAIVATLFTTLALTADYRFQDPAIDGKRVGKALLFGVGMTSPQDPDEQIQRCCAMWIVGVTMIRTIVPIWGLLALVVIGTAAYSVMREYYPVWKARDVNASRAVRNPGRHGGTKDEDL